MSDSLTPNYGRVEVYMEEGDGVWAQVCDLGNFQQTSADVICRQFGYNFAAHQCCGYLRLPREDLNVNYITEINCTGSETHVHHCEITTSISCPSTESVSLICSNETLVDNMSESIIFSLLDLILE